MGASVHPGVLTHLRSIASQMYTKVSRRGDSFSAGLVIPQVGKVPLGAPVGKDVEEEQQLPVNPTRGRHGTRQEGIDSSRTVGVAVTILRHLILRCVLQEPVDIRVAWLTVAAHVREMVADELVRKDSVDNQMPMVTEVGVQTATGGGRQTGGRERRYCR